MKFSYLNMLLGGVVIGAIFALVFLRVDPIASAESILSSDEEYTTESEVVANAVHMKESTTTKEENLLPASATSTGAVRVPIFVYHSVRAHIKGESKLQDAYDVTPELLEEELKYLRDGDYTTITFADVKANFDHGTPLPPKPVILSFDDGWRNEYEYAFPLLKKYNMRGTFFIFTNPIGRKDHWVTWEEIKEMEAAGMEIGGHTRTHPELTKIMTDKELDKEIAGGKKIIEDHLGHPVEVFAYPFGLEDERVVAAVARAGYSLGRTLSPGVWNDPAHALVLHGAIASDYMSDFKRNLNRE